MDLGDIGNKKLNPKIKPEIKTTRIIIKLILIILVTTNCNQIKDKSLKKHKNEINENSLKTDSYLVNTIIQKSKKRKDGILLLKSTNYRNNKIDFKFLEKYLVNFKTNNNIDLKAFFDKYSEYYFYDYNDFEDILLFTIIQNDEIGYDNFVHYVLDKNKNCFENTPKEYVELV